MKPIALFILTLLLTFTSCLKSNNEQMEGKFPIKKKTRAEKPYIKVKAKPHRQNGERKDHGGPCECEFCFGLCEIKVGVGWKFKSVAIKPTTDSTAKLHFLETLDETDEDFYVDNSVSIPAEALEGTGISSVSILPGIYLYDETQGTIYIDGDPYTTYGFITVKIEMTED